VSNRKSWYASGIAKWNARGIAKLVIVMDGRVAIFLENPSILIVYDLRKRERITIFKLEKNRKIYKSIRAFE
jgi:hypothetical protein